MVHNSMMNRTAALSQGELMQRLQEVGLTIDDLLIYLDINTHDTFAIERYNIAVADYQQLLNIYETRFGQMLKLQPSSDEANFLWALQDFPWDYEF